MPRSANDRFQIPNSKFPSSQTNYRITTFHNVQVPRIQNSEFPIPNSRFKQSKFQIPEFNRLFRSEEREERTEKRDKRREIIKREKREERREKREASEERDSITKQKEES